MILRRCPALALWLGLVLVIAGLHVAGQGLIRTPGLTSSDGWSTWLTRNDPAISAFALLRVLMLAVAWYTVVITTLTAAARFGGSGSLVAAVDRFTVPALRRVLAMTISASVVTGSFGALATRAGAQATDSPVTITMHRLAEGEAPGATGGAVATTPPASASSVPNAAGEWRVEKGDCFWTIAEHVLTASAGRQPSDAEIVPYWRRLIEANRGALADRANPDLIFPGQVFTVPLP